MPSFLCSISYDKHFLFVLIISLYKNTNTICVSVFIELLVAII